MKAIDTNHRWLIWLTPRKGQPHVVAASDDPIHPLEVALEWVSAAPRAALRTVTLEEFGPDPSVLGAACVAALTQAAG